MHPVTSSIRVRGDSPSSGSCSIAFTTSIPFTTFANAVYLWSSDGAGAVQMKNDVDALAGSSRRAIETVPATCERIVELGLQVGHELAFCFCVSGVGRVDTIPVCTTKPSDHPVEAGAVVDAGAGEAQEVADVLGRLVGQELERDRAA